MDREQEWWRSAVIHQIYPRSFVDGNGDGVGDLAGVRAHLDHLGRLGVDAVWFSPFYPSPQRDAGYDVAGHFDVAPEYGTLDDFRALLDDLHARGMRCIVDVVPNHVSSEHPLFRAALAAAPGSPERALFHFRRSAGAPPNNWGSVFGGSAWSRVAPLSGREEDAEWWYLHVFDSSQPDLDWSNPEVGAYFERVLRFWLDLGVDGFRVDVAHGCVKAEGLPDDDLGLRRGDGSTSTHEQSRGPMFDQEGVHDIHRRWRAILDEYPGECVLVAEAWVAPASRLARYVRPDEMHQSFNFEFLAAGWDAARLRDVIASTMRANAVVGAPTTWVLSNHDVVRPVTRLIPEEDGADGTGRVERGRRRARAAALLMLALPGAAYVYQGEELGLPEVLDIPDEARQDPTFARTGGKVRGRDGCRVPLPWTSEAATNFGFSASASAREVGEPWLPQPSWWGEHSVSRQEEDPDSFLTLYRSAITLRRRFGLSTGTLAHPALEGEWAWAEDLLALCNGEVTVLVNMSGRSVALPVGTQVLLASRPGAAGDVLAPDDAVWCRLPAAR